MEATSQERSNQAQVKRKIRNFLIDSRFQLGWVFKVAVVTAFVVGIMGYFLYGKLAESTDLIVGQALAAEGLSPDAQQAIIEQAPHDKMVALIVLGAGLIGIVVILSLLTIVATHKIAGPAYKIRKLFLNVDGDHLQLWAKLRKGDQLHDVFTAFDDMLRRLRESRRHDMEILESIINASSEEELSPSQQEKIKAILKKFSSSIEMN